MPLTPFLTATPNTPVTYNPGMAETFSWVPIQGADRPLFARATYLISDSLESLASDTASSQGQNGFDFISSTAARYGTYTSVQVISSCRVANLTATNSTIGNLSAFTLSENTVFFGPIAGIQLQYGAVIAYK